MSLGAWVRLRARALYDELQVWVDEMPALQVDLRATQDELSAARWTSSSTDPDEPARRVPILRQGGAGLQASSTTVAFRQMAVREAVLLRLPFMTSAFESFEQLAGSAQSFEVVSPGASGVTVDPGLTARYAAARQRYARGTIDHRDERIDREALERLKLELRDAQAEMDEQFRAVADALVPGHVYQPVGENLEVYLLRDPSTGASNGIWLKSPESLDVQLSVPGEAAHVGRTAIELQDEHGGAVPARLLAIGDGTHVLLLPQGSAFPAGAHSLSLVYHHDQGDEGREDDHRYDRPILYPEGEETVSIGLTL